jgi:uncharacterized membrane protein (UPF0127 family)
MTGNGQHPDGGGDCDGDRDGKQKHGLDQERTDHDPTDQPLLPEGTIARRIVDRLRNPRVIAVLIIVFVPMIAWVGYTVHADLTSPDYGTATIYDENGDYLESVEGNVAATWREQYTGLSDTDSLEDGHGMIFIHETEKEHTYVMRDMGFPIDIVFIDKEGRITEIYHAELEDSEPLTEYRGQAKYVIEVPYHWTTENGIDVGDTVKFRWGSPRSETGRMEKASRDDAPPNDVPTAPKRRPTASSP